MNILVILGIVLAIITGVFVLLIIIAAFIPEGIEAVDKRFRDRIIKLSPKMRKELKTTDKYGKILEVTRVSKGKVIEVKAELFPSQKTYTEAKRKYDEEFETQKKRYEDELGKYKNRERMVNGTI